MQRPLLLLILTAALAAQAPAQNAFRATLDGAQEVPPVATTAGGWGTLLLNPDSSVTYRVETWNITGTMAHIHLGAFGVPGGVIVPLSGGPTVWSGTSAPLTAGQVTSLRAAGTYFNVHSAAFPGGEIRGQILPSPASFAAFANGAQEVPANASTATASGTFLVNPDRSITYAVTSTGLTAIDAHIHTGAVGAPGGVLFGLTPGPTSWSGTTPPMTESQYASFQNGGMYLNIHTAAFPGGEIRGQIYSAGESYGFGCAGGGVSNCQLSSTGVPMSGRAVQLQVSAGAPGGSGFIGISFDPAAALFGGCQRLIDLPTVKTIPMTLNGAGAGSKTLNLPMIGADKSIYLQFGGFSGGALSYTSNGWAVRVEVL